VNPQDFADRVRAVLEESPDGLAFSQLMALTGLTKQQTHTGMERLRKQLYANASARRLFYMDRETFRYKLTFLPEDALQITVQRLQFAHEQMFRETQVCALLLAEEGPSDEMKRLYEVALGLLDQMDDMVAALLNTPEQNAEWEGPTS
jgi:hypothetical protein